MPSAYQEDASCWLDPLLEPNAVLIGAGTLTLAFRQGTLRTSYGGNLFDDSRKARVRWEQLAVQLPSHLDEMSLNCDPEKVADMQSWCE